MTIIATQDNYDVVTQHSYAENGERIQHGTAAWNNMKSFSISQYTGDPSFEGYVGSYYRYFNTTEPAKYLVKNVNIDYTKPLSVRMLVQLRGIATAKQKIAGIMVKTDNSPFDRLTWFNNGPSTHNGYILCMRDQGTDGNVSVGIQHTMLSTNVDNTGPLATVATSQQDQWRWLRMDIIPPVTDTGVETIEIYTAYTSKAPIEWLLLEKITNHTKIPNGHATLNRIGFVAYESVVDRFEILQDLA